MQAARDVVIREWNLRRPVELDTRGGWHVCHRSRCTIVHLKEHVCMEGNHICSGTCALHPRSNIICVSDVYACKEVGAVHVCNQSTCQASSGQCDISGQSCMAEAAATVVMPASNKRSRRRANSVHTNEQTACILVFDLLFSSRRITAEVQRAQTVLEHARRVAHRLTKNAIRSGAALNVQDLIDIYASARQRMRSYQYIRHCTGTAAQKEICMYYANIIVSIWNIVMHALPARSTFESIAAAVLYSMRKGVACDGMHAIPVDHFLRMSLPDAHSIKDVGVARRALTQARNALFRTIHDFISNGSATVELFLNIFKLDKPASVQTLLDANYKLE